MVEKYAITLCLFKAFLTEEDFFRGISRCTEVLEPDVAYFNVR